MLLLIPATAILLSSAQAHPTTIREAAAKRRMLFGTCIAARFLGEPDYAEVAGREFSQIEPENEMKFSSLHPRPDTDPNPYDFKDADAIVAYGLAHKMKVRGHCFVWYQQVSQWVTRGSHTPEELNKVLDSHIQTVGKHFAGKVYAWDVVNEAFLDNGSLRHSVWFDRPGIGLADKGPAYIEQAFRWARKVDRRAKLYYNDYGAEMVNKKSDAIYAMAVDFKKRHVPLDGIGFQVHIEPTYALNAGYLDSMKKNFKRFADLGLDLQITEMDVALTNNKPESLAKQADLYRAVVDACLAERRFNAIQTWGFTDKHSWINQFGGGKGWALMFDDQYKPKPAFESIVDALSRKK